MKAIETQYKGYRFRSRLEARWAVFFDALNLAWEYEPEGFELNDVGTRFLPDFLIRSVEHDPYDLWIEVKPRCELPVSEWQKFEAFVEGFARDGIQAACMICLGAPLDVEAVFAGFLSGKKKAVLIPPDKDGFNAFCFILAARSGKSLQQVEKAAEVARMARFEFGEKG